MRERYLELYRRLKGVSWIPADERRLTSEEQTELREIQEGCSTVGEMLEHHAVVLSTLDVEKNKLAAMKKEAGMFNKLSKKEQSACMQLTEQERLLVCRQAGAALSEKQSRVALGATIGITADEVALSLMLPEGIPLLELNLSTIEALVQVRSQTNDTLRIRVGKLEALDMRITPPDAVLSHKDTEESEGSEEGWEILVEMSERADPASRTTLSIKTVCHLCVMLRMALMQPLVDFFMPHLQELNESPSARSPSGALSPISRRIEGLQPRIIARKLPINLYLDLPAVDLVVGLGGALDEVTHAAGIVLKLGVVRVATMDQGTKLDVQLERMLSLMTPVVSQWKKSKMQIVSLGATQVLLSLQRTVHCTLGIQVSLHDGCSVVLSNSRVRALAKLLSGILDYISPLLGMGANAMLEVGSHSVQGKEEELKHLDHQIMSARSDCEELENHQPEPSQRQQHNEQLRVLQDKLLELKRARKGLSSSVSQLKKHAEELAKHSVINLSMELPQLDLQLLNEGMSDRRQLLLLIVSDVSLSMSGRTSVGVSLKDLSLTDPNTSTVMLQLPNGLSVEGDIDRGIMTHITSMQLIPVFDTAVGVLSFMQKSYREFKPVIAALNTMKALSQQQVTLSIHESYSVCGPGCLS